MAIKRGEMRASAKRRDDMCLYEDTSSVLLSKGPSGSSALLLPLCYRSYLTDNRLLSF